MLVKEVRCLTGSSVCCVGELLIDMFCTDVDVSLKDGSEFRKMAGGAPANVAATISTLGGNSSFVGKVGNDAFGEFLIETLESFKVDTSMVKMDDRLATTMAFVSLTADGERDFQFNRGADGNLLLSDVDVESILQSIILHFGSATALLDGESKETYYTLLEKASEKGRFISFDPNFRQDLWKGKTDVFVRRARKAIAKADFIKVSREELEILTAEQDMEKGIAILHSLGGKLVAVTLGSQGSIISNGREQALMPSIEVTAIDSTGAGDAFVGAVLYQLSKVKKEADLHNFDYLKEVIYFANTVAAKVCTNIGSLTALKSL